MTCLLVTAALPRELGVGIFADRKDVRRLVRSLEKIRDRNPLQDAALGQLKAILVRRRWKSVSLSLSAAGLTIGMP